jgi:hypothetical protein
MSKITGDVPPYPTENIKWRVSQKIENISDLKIFYWNHDFK